ncbi:glycosyltransferase family 39 protein [Thermodesulfobacteriota bacterium]
MTDTKPLKASPGSEPTSGTAESLLLIALIGVFLWRIMFSISFNLIPDECSYWAWSRRLDWSYFDNSPMVAYLIRFSTSLFGESSPLSVRFPFLLLSGLTTYLVYLSSRSLFGDRQSALLSAAILNVTPLGLLAGCAAIHDNALVFFWVLTIWTTVRFVETDDARWFYWMGMSAGFAILCKYTGVLVLPSILIFLLWSPAHRHWLLKKEPWIGALIASAFALPIIYWNIKHDWASLYHVLFIGAGAVSLARKLGDAILYHLAQFLLISPLFYVALLAGVFTALSGNLRKPCARDVLLISFSLPLFIFGMMAVKGHVEANWAVMGYPSAVILAVEVIRRAHRERLTGILEHFTPKFFKRGLALSLGISIVVVAHAWIGLLPASLERAFAKEDRIIWETTGWDGLGRRIAEEHRPNEVIAADSYQLCALLEFNVPGNPDVRYLAPWKRPTQFDVWHPSFGNLVGRDVLFVSSRPLVPSVDGRITVYDNFRRVERLKPYEVIYHSRPIRKIYIYRGRGFDTVHNFLGVPLEDRSLFYVD